MKWYVYVGRHNDEIVYVGKGTGNRMEHLNSGKSNCYHANKLHFSGEFINVEVVQYFDTEHEALIHEKKLIEIEQPIGNTIYARQSVDRPAITRRQTKKRKNAKSKYLGVQCRTSGKRPFVAIIKIDGKSIDISRHSREIDAAIARDLYIINNNIANKTLNFPDKNYSEILDDHIKWD